VGIGLLLCPPQVRGQDDGAEVTPSPEHRTGARVLQVLLLSAGSGEVAVEREQRLVTELQLLLDGYEVVVTPMLDRDFVALTRAEQVAAVEPLARIAGAWATIWIQPSGAGTSSLFVVFAASQEVLARSIDTSAASNPEAEIALTASELIDKMDSSEGPTRQGEGGSDDPAGSSPPAAETSGEPPGPTPVTTVAGRWSLDAAFLAGGGVGDGAPAVALGGRLAVGFAAEAGWFVRAGASAGSEPGTGVERGLQVAARVAPELTAGIAWRLGRMRIAPFVSVAAPFTRYRVALETMNDSEHWRVNLLLGLGFELGLRVHERVWIFAAAGAGSPVFRDRFRRSSDGSVERAAAVESRTEVGVGFDL